MVCNPRTRSEKDYKISHEDVSKATNEFEENGGSIQKLPDQMVQLRREVNPSNPANQYLAYERIDGMRYSEARES